MIVINAIVDYPECYAFPGILVPDFRNIDIDTTQSGVWVIQIPLR